MTDYNPFGIQPPGFTPKQQVQIQVQPWITKREFFTSMLANGWLSNPGVTSVMTLSAKEMERTMESFVTAADFMIKALEQKEVGKQQ